MKNQNFFLLVLLMSTLLNNALAQTNITESITVNSVWTESGSPYIIADDDVVIENGITLVIEPGVEVHFSDYLHYLSVKGTLEANGELGNEIRFWGSETIADGFYGGIFIDGGIANISHAEFERNGPVLKSDHFELYAQIHAESGVLNIEHSRFWDTPLWYGIALEEGVVFSGNNNDFDITEEGSTAYLVAPDVAMTMDISDNSYSPNVDFITIRGEIDDVDITWDIKEVPYLCFTTQLDNVNLTIEPGVELNFYSGGSLWVFGGSIMAEGTDTQPIRFVGGFPEADHFGNGIYLWTDGNIGLNNYFEHCVFQQLNYGVISYPIAFQLDSLFSVRNSSFDNIQENALYGYYTTPIVISNCFSNIGQNAIENATFDATEVSINANNNYWDDPSGAFHSDNYPNGLGESVSNGVIADNPLNSCPNVEFIDLAIGTLLSPNITCETGNDFAITIRIDNLGFTTQSDFDLQLIVNNESPVIVSPNITVPGSGFTDFTFSPTIDINHFETNEIEVSIVFPDDQNPVNNTASFFIQSIPFDGQTLDAVTVCDNNEFFQLTASGGVNYEWSTGSTSPFIWLNTPIQSADYYVTITNAIGCTDLDTISVNALEVTEPVAFASSYTLCPGGTVNLTVQNVSGNFFWNTEQTGNSIVVGYPGDYYVSYADDNGCIATSQPVHIAEESMPEIGVLGDGIICNQDSETLQVSNISGSSFVWSTGETTPAITVSPSVSTDYSVMVTTPNNCIHTLEETVTVAASGSPEPVSNMIPLDNDQNIALPVSFSWAPGANTTHYDVFIWETGDAEPLLPTFSTTQISESYVGNLQYGSTYNWKVCSRNVCGVADSVCSMIQTFTLNYLPDLIVTDDFSFPDNAFSGIEIQVGWQVENNGLGSTQNISNNGQWYDVCYLSVDTLLNVGDLFLGGQQNPNALQQGDDYNNSINTQLPNTLSGEYYIIVCTDVYTSMPESNEQNNCTRSSNVINIQQSPYPDLQVTAFPPPAGAGGGIIAAGADYNIQWTVENKDHGLNAAITQSGGWSDRVYISANSSFDPQTADILTTVFHQGNLNISESYTASTSIQIPDNMEGSVYLFVCTDVFDSEFEFAFENNNHIISIPLFIPSVPKPNFTLNSISAPDTASNKENILISWTGTNEAADFSGAFSDRIFISEYPDFSGWHEPLGSSYQQYSDLSNGEGYGNDAMVQIPDNITGKFYLIAWTNAYGSIEETDFSNNTFLDSIIIVSPNLTVAEISTIPDAFSGETVTIDWKLANIGAGSLLSSHVTDRVRLVDVSNPGNWLVIATSGSNFSLFTNDTLLRQTTYNIPNGLTGDYCIEVTTNYNFNLYENGQYGDNLLINCDTFHIAASNYPDLVAESIQSIESTSIAGEQIDLKFRVANDGAASTSGNWRDKIYLSNSNIWNSNTAIFLEYEEQSQVIVSDSFYEKTISVQLSASLAPGAYYLHLVTDAEGDLFESNDNNNLITSTEVLNVVAYPEVDLRFEGIPTGPASISPGQTATLTYTVENDGNAVTPVSTWTDALYLSPNPEWTPSDILIKEWQHDGALLNGTTYSRQESFTLPPGFTDAFYLCLVIDHENAVNEANENNNFIKILQQNGDTITINYPPNPDLTVTDFSAPSNGVSGQPLEASFVIQNIATEGDAVAPWKESVYLSTDTNLSADDVLLASHNYDNELSSGAFYNKDISITLPLNASGNYFLLIKTDDGDHINEQEETNNLDYQYIFITQPSPGDLWVAESGIQFQPIDTISSDFTVAWTVKNIGQNPVVGFMEQGVYLSEDMTWDAADVLLDTWTGNVILDPNTSVSHSLTARLENVNHQQYHIFIKTDLVDHFFEDNELNNCSIGNGTVFIEVPELPIGLPATSVIVDLERPIYYRIEIPVDTVGETMRVSVSSTDSTAFNELYIRHNEIPSRTTHDFIFDAPFEENQEIIIPALDSGTYYVMVYAVDGLATQNIELLAEIIPFQITSINANQGGNTGTVTSLMKGAKFEDGMTVRLEKAGLPTIFASAVNVINNAKAFVTFPLNGASIGVYDVVAETATDQAVLENGFEVKIGTIGNHPLLTSCSLDYGPQNIAVTNVPANVEILNFGSVHPASVRPNQTVSITLLLQNSGDVDIPVPSKILSSINGFPLASQVNNLGQNAQDLALTFMEQGGPPDVLRPGGIAIITVYSKATQSEGVLKFKLLSN